MAEHRRIGLAVVVALFGLVALAAMSPAGDPFRQVHQFTAALAGQSPMSDLTQDVVGARALVEDRDAYPTMSLQPHPDIPTRPGGVGPGSTHPPTAFLLALPVALFSWGVAAAAWAWMTLGLYVVAGRLMGASWPSAIAVVPLWVLWPPTGWAFGQWTALWLVCGLLAWRWRHRPGWAGGAIAVASMGKLLPALLLLMFWRRWRAWGAFAGAWVVALGLVAAFNASALWTYARQLREAADVHVGRLDNGSVVAVADRIAGPGGAVLAVVAIAVVLLHGLRSGGEQAWGVTLWASVALLPVAWIYSVVPLVPLVVRRRALWPLLVLPLLIAPYRDPAGGLVLALLVAGCGASLLVAGRHLTETTAIAPPTELVHE